VGDELGEGEPIKSVAVAANRSPCPI
jgi:hypothetical protein